MMQHPAPSLRSRLTGSALAGVLGVAAIFSTASCMAAQADGTENNSFHFFYKSGQSDDQQTVLLSDPFAGLEPSFEAIGEMDFGTFDMDFDIEVDMAELNLELSELMSELEGLQELEVLKDLEGLRELEGLGDMLTFETTSEDGEHVIILKSGETIEDVEVFMERWDEGLELRMEQWADRMEEHAEVMEKRAEAMSIRIERKAEAAAATHEARAEAWAAKIEATFDEDFEKNIEAAAAVVESLSEQCEARGSENEMPEIVSTKNTVTGEIFRALCVNGDRERLSSDGLDSWIAGRSDLSDEEKAYYKSHKGKNIVFEFSSDTSIIHDADLEGGTTHKIIIQTETSSDTELDGAAE